MRVHYARDGDFQPICGDGEDGDRMTFFLDFTCEECTRLMTADLSKFADKYITAAGAESFVAAAEEDE